MTEDEQSDDPELVEQWVDDLQSIPPVPENPGEGSRVAGLGRGDAAKFNIEAVREQFEEDTP